MGYIFISYIFYFIFHRIIFSTTYFQGIFFHGCIFNEISYGLDKFFVGYIFHGLYFPRYIFHGYNIFLTRGICPVWRHIYSRICSVGYFVSVFVIQKDAAISRQGGRGLTGFPRGFLLLPTAPYSCFCDSLRLHNDLLNPSCLTPKPSNLNHTPRKRSSKQMKRD